MSSCIKKVFKDDELLKKWANTMKIDFLKKLRHPNGVYKRFLGGCLLFYPLNIMNSCIKKFIKIIRNWKMSKYYENGLFEKIDTP